MSQYKYNLFLKILKSLLTSAQSWALQFLLT